MSVRRTNATAPTGLAARVLHLRQTLGWDQRTLAREAGCSAATICRLEVGNRTPCAAHLVAIAQALGVSVETLWYGPSGPRSKADEPAAAVVAPSGAYDRLAEQNKRIAEGIISTYRDPNWRSS